MASTHRLEHHQPASLLVRLPLGRTVRRWPVGYWLHQLQHQLQRGIHSLIDSTRPALLLLLLHLRSQLSVPFDQIYRRSVRMLQTTVGRCPLSQLQCARVITSSARHGGQHTRLVGQLFAFVYREKLDYRIRSTRRPQTKAVCLTKFLQLLLARPQW